MNNSYMKRRAAKDARSANLRAMQEAGRKLQLGVSGTGQALRGTQHAASPVRSEVIDGARASIAIPVVPNVELRGPAPAPAAERKPSEEV